MNVCKYNKAKPHTTFLISKKKMRKMKTRRSHRARKTRRIRKTHRGGMNGNNSNSSTAATLTGSTANVYKVAQALVNMKTQGTMPLANESEYSLNKPRAPVVPPVVKAQAAKRK
jgi:hypothetical protein